VGSWKGKAWELVVVRGQCAVQCWDVLVCVHDGAGKREEGRGRRNLTFLLVAALHVSFYFTNFTRERV